MATILAPSACMRRITASCSSLTLSLRPFLLLQLSKLRKLRNFSATCTTPVGEKDVEEVFGVSEVLLFPAPLGDQPLLVQEQVKVPGTPIQLSPSLTPDLRRADPAFDLGNLGVVAVQVGIQNLGGLTADRALEAKRYNKA